MTTVPTYAITVHQGATYTLSLTLTENSAAFNLPPWSARMQMRRRHQDEATWVSLTSAPGGGIVLGGAAGTIAIRIEAAVTADFPVERGVYDIEIEHIDGTVRRILQGSVTVTPEVTRPVTP